MALTLRYRRTARCRRLSISNRSTGPTRLVQAVSPTCSSAASSADEGAHAFVALDITTAHALHVGDLPAHHQDPFDESRWDGSDFMFLDGNPNIVVVSARAAEVFNTNGFTNVVAEPLG